MPVEVASMKNCRYLLFNIHPKSTCIYSVIEAAYHCASQPSRVVLCVKELSQEMADGKKLSTIAWRDYNRGRKYLSGQAPITQFYAFFIFGKIPLILPSTE